MTPAVHAPAPSAARLVDGSELASLVRGTPLLVLLDIDGTLSDIVSDPHGAVVPEATQRTLARLAAIPSVQVVLLTGRAVREARRMVPVPGIPIIGNHGLEWLDAAGDARPVEGWDAVAPRVRRAHEVLVAHVSRIPGAVLEDKTYSLTVHYRNVDAAQAGALRDAVRAVAEREGLRTADGKCVVNILPPIDVDKGHAALRLARDGGAAAPGAAILFAGDDVTDESAFRALAGEMPHAVTVRVATTDAPTSARLRIPSPAALARALELIAEQRAA